MQILSRKPFVDASNKYPMEADAIARAYRVLCAGDFFTPNQLKQVFPTLTSFKYEKRWWLLDLGGQFRRLVALVELMPNRLYVHHILNHADYDKLCKAYSQPELKF